MHAARRGAEAAAAKIGNMEKEKTRFHARGAASGGGGGGGAIFFTAPGSEKPAFAARKVGVAP